MSLKDFSVEKITRKVHIISWKIFLLLLVLIFISLLIFKLDNDINMIILIILGTLLGLVIVIINTTYLMLKFNPAWDNDQ